MLNVFDPLTVEKYSLYVPDSSQEENFCPVTSLANDLDAFFVQDRTPFFSIDTSKAALPP